MPISPIPARSFHHAALGAGLLLAFSACSLARQLSFERPSMTVQAIEVTTLTLAGGALRVTLDVHNPNPYAIRGGAFSGELTLEDTPFGMLRHDRTLDLAAHARTPIVLDMTFVWEGMGAAARAILSRGSVSYQLVAKMLVTTPIDDRWVQLGAAGSIALRDLVR